MEVAVTPEKEVEEPQLSPEVTPEIPQTVVPKSVETEASEKAGVENCAPNGSTNVPPISKITPPKTRTSFLPKPEVGPKPAHLRMSPVRRQLPVASGPCSLNIMTTSLPSPFSNTGGEFTRSVWGHRGSFSEAIGTHNRLSGSSSSSHSSPHGSPGKGNSPSSPNSKIPCPTNSLHHITQSVIQDQSSPKACTRNCGVNDLTSTTPRSGNLSKLTAKASGTASILRSTLRRMTRLAVSVNGSTSADKQQQISPVTPSPVRNASAKLEGPNSSPSSRKLIAQKNVSPHHIQRSRSFRDASSDTLGARTGPSSIGSVNSFRSNSLRRSQRNKDHPLQQQHGPNGGAHTMRPAVGLQRSGTGGTLDRASVRRSNSTAGTAARKIRERDQHNVRKSRGCQTLLTKDSYFEDGCETEASNPNLLEFTVYLPDLLGSGGDDNVELHVVEPTEPIDIRRNRQLTLDNMRLNRELEKLKSQLAETDSLKRELKNAKMKLEEEQRTRIRIEQQLDQHNEKVVLIAQSMDRVEREFESRDNHIASLESKLTRAESDLSAANDVIAKQRSEIAQGLDLQKTLLLQYQESEIESKELHEFLQAEKYTLAETLKDCELEMASMKSEIDKKKSEIVATEERCAHLVRLGEQRNQEIKLLKAQLSGLEDKARSTILAQGAELATAHAILTELLNELKSHYPFDDVTQEEIKTPRITEKVKKMSHSKPEKKPEEKVEESIKGCLLDDPTLQNLSDAIAKRHQSQEIEFFDDLSLEENEGPNLESKLELLKILVDKLVSDLKNRIHSSQTNGNGVTQSVTNSPEQLSANGKSPSNTQNGHSSSLEMSCLDSDGLELNSTIAIPEDNDKKEELIKKFLKHRKILMYNCEQAELEIKRVDEIYFDTISHVLKVLDALPAETRNTPDLVELKRYLEEDEHMSAGYLSIKSSKNDLNEADSILAGKRHLIQISDAVTPAINQSL